MKYACQTLFDITATGVTGHFKSTRIPFRDRSGFLIASERDWNRARNQQRNWETITQILSLRTQLFDITDPVLDSAQKLWMFEFFTEQSGTFGPELDPCEVLRSDANGVPMLQLPDGQTDINSYLITAGPGQNIWFSSF
jgi:hypothetical protein